MNSILFYETVFRFLCKENLTIVSHSNVERTVFYSEMKMLGASYSELLIFFLFLFILNQATIFDYNKIILLGLLKFDGSYYLQYIWYSYFYSLLEMFIIFLWMNKGEGSFYYSCCSYSSVNIKLFTCVRWSIVGCHNSYGFHNTMVSSNHTWEWFWWNRIRAQGKRLVSVLLEVMVCFCFFNIISIPHRIL